MSEMLVSGDGVNLTDEGRQVIPEERRRLVLELLRKQGSISVLEVEEQFGVSPMTARRDLTILAQEGKARRTHGGALLPELAAHEDSFDHRLERYRDAKERLALRAVEFLKPSETVFVDSSSTAYYAVKAAIGAGLPLTIVTNSLPVMTLVSAAGTQIDLVGLGGSFRHLTRSYVGPDSVRAVQGYFADRLLFSVKGITTDGYLTDPDPLEAELKMAMVERARCSVLLATEDKFSERGLSVVAPLDRVGIALLADAPPSADRLLVSLGVEVHRV
jgi:DeoR family transcriptional regulator of aga operon